MTGGLMQLYWYEQNMNDVPTEKVWLSAAEMDHLRSLRVAKRRADWLLGRWTAKKAVAKFQGLTASLSTLADIEIRPAASGAPRTFVRGQLAPISLSLSHRNGVALCALAAHGVLLGCDLEAVEAHSDAFATDYFSPEEQALAQRTLVSERDWFLSLLWSGKESALKALETGLRLDTRQVIVSVPGIFERRSEGTGNPSPSPFFSVRKFSRDKNGWHTLEVRNTSGQILLGWWSQTSNLVRTVVADPPPDPPVLIT